MKLLMLLGAVILLFVVGMAVIVFAWGWIVPDVFAGVAEQGVLPASLTLAQAFKLWILLAVLGLLNTQSSKK